MRANFFDMLVAALAVWRLAHMFRYEAGPWDIFIRIRKRLGNSVFGKVMDCIYCMSIWFAIIFFVPGTSYLVLLLAVSALAIFCEVIHGALLREEKKGPAVPEIHGRLPWLKSGI